MKEGIFICLKSFQSVAEVRIPLFQIFRSPIAKACFTSTKRNIFNGHWGGVEKEREEREREEQRGRERGKEGKKEELNESGRSRNLLPDSLDKMLNITKHHIFLHL